MDGRLRRLVLYGCLGWVLEVAFTGAASLLSRDFAATSRTYLWMFPIYGAGGLALERFGALLARRGARRAFRALAYVPIVYAIELSTGWILCRLIGHCPWDYGDQGVNFLGLVRWDFAPFWYLFSWGFDLLWTSLTKPKAPETRGELGNQSSRIGLVQRSPSASRVEAGSFGQQPV